MPQYWMFSSLLCVAVARVLCPWAAELLDHPGERGGGAREGSTAKIQQLPAEASTGPGTTRPLTPEPLTSTPVLWSSGRETDPQSPSDSPIYSETAPHPPALHRTYTQTRGASTHRCRPPTQDATSPPAGPQKGFSVRVWSCKTANEDTNSGKTNCSKIRLLNFSKLVHLNNKFSEWCFYSLHLPSSSSSVMSAAAATTSVTYAWVSAHPAAHRVKGVT